ncbi:MAG: DNA gyrase subunit A [Oscillospiraceae bacterium]|nr:DNA gyrase subunit A [Oscillospiraceae bacterium]
MPDVETAKLHPSENLLQVDIEKEMKTSFLEYSMSVIVARALPDVRDGLKPVHRRILYTQFEEGLTHDKPFSKCAKTVGAVLGSYHPHGDQSVYDALVRMTQDFSLRYPLIEGHGNFGSIGGDAPAAYRYTESRLARISAEMLADINKETVDYVPNYDDTKKEPATLPCRFPNLLVNGSTGIAVGMATNIPPHNLSEVIDALQLMLLSDEEIPLDMLMTVIKGPDFPTGGVIMGHSGIRSAYYTGRGKITLRGKAEIEEKGNHQRIVITEIPYMVNMSKLLQTIDMLVKEKRLEGVSLCRDESDRNGMKIVIELKRDANASVILSKLYSFSQLQETIGVIMLALVNGEPKILNLKQMLQHYIEYQESVVTRRTQFDLKKAQARAHILEGFIVVIDNLDEVIAIIRSSDDPAHAKSRLIERFGLTDIQAEAIAQMRIIQLTKLGRKDIEEELAALNIKIGEFTDLLADKKAIRKVVSDELDVIRTKFCAKDGRRTAIEAVSGEVDIEDLIPVEESVLTFTNLGYIKRQPVEAYNLQKRGGRGVSGMKQRDEDFVESLFIASSHDYILFVTNLGNMYRLKCYEVPEGSKQSRGTNIVNLFQLHPEERITAMLKTSDFAEGKYFICVTKNGRIKRSALSLFKNIRKNGLRAINLLEGDEIVSAHLTEGDSSVIIATKNGRAIHFDESIVRSQGRVASGVRAIKFRNDYGDDKIDCVVGAAKVYDENSTILTVSEKGFGRRSNLASYAKKNRGGFGLLNYRPDEERGHVCGIKTLYADDDVILINDEGIIIRIRSNDIRTMGRYGKGVRVMRISETGRVVTFTRTEHDDSAELEEVEQADEAEILAAEAMEKAEVVEPEPEPELEDEVEIEDSEALTDAENTEK